MDTTHDDDDFWNQFNLDALPAFETAGDLARYSIQTHQQHNPLHRTLASHGFLRLAGVGVTGHAVNAVSAFQVGIAFQKAITAIGSSLVGAKKSLSKSAELLTQLKLDGSPAPGSLVFNLVAESQPATELRPRGEIMDMEEQLVDRSFDALRYVLTPLDSMEKQEEVARYLEELGPWAVVALRNFVTEIGDNYFDLELRWEQPLKPALHLEMPTADSLALKRFIVGRQLDEEPVRIYGALHTVSVTRRWIVTSQEYGRITVDLDNAAKGLNRDDFPPGRWVLIEAMMSERRSAGDEVRRKFRATSISRADPPFAD